MTSYNFWKKYGFGWLFKGIFFFYISQYFWQMTVHIALALHTISYHVQSNTNKYMC